MAASWMPVTRSEPKSIEASSPMRPLLRFTIRMRPSSRTDRRSRVLRPCPTMARRIGWLRNCPTLFWIGAMASA